MNIRLIAKKDDDSYVEGLLLGFGSKGGYRASNRTTAVLLLPDNSVEEFTLSRLIGDYSCQLTTST